jgi:hypothetical protein
MTELEEATGYVEGGEDLAGVRLAKTSVDIFGRLVHADLAQHASFLITFH